MMHQQMRIEIQCPVCTHPVNYPDEMMCGQCGCLVIVGTGKPTTSYVDRLGRLKHLRNNDFLAYREKDRENQRIELQINDLRPHHKFQKDQLDERQKKVSVLTKQKNDLRANSISTYDLDKIEEAVSALDYESHRLSLNLPQKREYKTPPVTIQCSYDYKLNTIKAVVTELRQQPPVFVEPLLGLAVSSRPFEHYLDAEMVIPVKNRDHQVKIYETGDVFQLELMHWPEKPIAHFQVIHLYALTVSKFTIE